MILSWDIGIKNLSYCILSIVTKEDLNKNANHKIISLNNKLFQIHHWDVINLVEALENMQSVNNEENIGNNNSTNIKSFNQRYKLICNHEKCKKVAKYSFNENHTKGFCSSHFVKLDNNIKKDYFYIGDKLPKCIKEDCKKKATFILETHHYKTYCTIHQKQLIKQCPTIKTLKMNKKVKATHINLNHLGEILYKELDKLEFLLDNKITNILLENQPVLKNPTMKSMQMLLYGYFILRGKVDKNLNIVVNCYSANQKNTLLKYLNDESKFRINDEIKHIKSKYTRNKKESIMISEVLLKDCSQLIDWFKMHKKKDDLADSLLMNLHYLNKQNT